MSLFHKDNGNYIITVAVGTKDRLFTASTSIISEDEACAFLEDNDGNLDDKKGHLLVIE